MDYRALSPWQKPNCINQNAEYTCPNPATQEAFIRVSKNHVIGIRCCDELACTKRAEVLALASVPEESL